MKKTLPTRALSVASIVALIVFGITAGPAEAAAALTVGGAPMIGGRSLGVFLGVGGAAALAKSFANDRRIETALQSSPFEGLIEPGDVFGDGRTAGLGALGLYAVGRLAHSERLTAAGGDLCESLLVTWSSVWALKLLIDEDRPTGGNYSFPSGHTATAFATASVLSEHFGPAAGVPAYALATATALARLEDRRHYLSDVLFGAAIGFVVGSEVSRGGRLAALSDHVAVSDRAIAVKLSF